MTRSSQDLAIVIGATGGIGAALVAALERGGPFDTVVALSRNSAPALDILDEQSVVGAARRVGEMGTVRYVIDATGVLHDAAMVPEKRLSDIDPTVMARAFAVNAIGPMLVMKHFLPLLAREERAVFATLSARVGSIGDNRLGGWYSYRASKAALNQGVRTAAVELARRAPHAICVALHPGTVDTALTRSFAKVGLDVQTPDAAAERLLAVIADLGPSDSGGFFDHRGAPVPW